MATLRTKVTEIVTGLSMIDDRPLDEVFDDPLPSELVNVNRSDWDQLIDAHRNGDYKPEFKTAWSNGRRFRNSPEGLRGRRPAQVEWKGNHKPPAYETVPADLRVDHVYLISCKYGSEVVQNPAPFRLFDSLLEPHARVPRGDWYDEVAPDAYRTFYSAVRRELGDLPERIEELTPEDRLRIKRAFEGSWPDDLQPSYDQFCRAVGSATARRWEASITSKRVAERLLWRVLRLESAPYYLLGTTRHGTPIRVRVMTPWDWRQRFRLDYLTVGAATAQQPRVDWTAYVIHLESGSVLPVQGHVEIRWSHGRFSGNPEAKLYLDTPHHGVPGYVDLDGKPQFAAVPLGEQLAWDV